MARITEITVSAGRTFNDPFESYANFKPGVTLRASIDEGEDATVVVKELQAKAEGLMEDHKRNLLKSLRELKELSDARQEMVDAEQSIKRTQARLDEMRAKHPELKLLPEGEDAKEMERAY